MRMEWSDEQLTAKGLRMQVSMSATSPEWKGWATGSNALSFPCTAICLLVTMDRTNTDGKMSWWGKR